MGGLFHYGAPFLAGLRLEGMMFVHCARVWVVPVPAISLSNVA